MDSTDKNKVIVRIKGGLGNQLFSYAAARRLALVNSAELVIDNITGFARDYRFRRNYNLDRFCIPVRTATKSERMEPLERYRRGVMKWLSYRKPFPERNYLEQEGLDFDERLLSLKVKGTLYLDGYWQSEKYFKDFEHIIRKDLRIEPPADIVSKTLAGNIKNSKNSVALHVRWFDHPGSDAINNASSDYYRRAIALMNKKFGSPHYFLFSDNPEAAREILSLSDESITIVSHNREKKDAFIDLWLMSKCHNFIIANSTFSWWGAWLSNRKEKIVVCPDMKIIGESITAWDFEGQLPENWQKI